MHRLIAQNQAEIAEICRRYGVRRLEVFGSAARGEDFDPDRSDFDFLIDVDREATPDFSAGDYFALTDELASALGRRVDLVFMNSVSNPYVKADIDRAREIVYAP